MVADDLPYAREYLQLFSLGRLPQDLRLPARLDPDFCRDGLQIGLDGRTVSVDRDWMQQFRASGNCVSARSDRRFLTTPSYCKIYYFEMRVIELGRQCKAGIGLLIDVDSSAYVRIVYWSDGSLSFKVQDQAGEQTMPSDRDSDSTFGYDDVVGCGFRVGDRSFFTSRNGKNSDVIPQPDVQNLLDRASARTVDPRVYGHPALDAQMSLHVNFGQEPFVLDVGKYLTPTRPARLSEVASALPQELLSLIARYSSGGSSTTGGDHSFSLSRIPILREHNIHLRRLSLINKYWARFCRPMMLEHVVLSSADQVPSLASFVNSVRKVGMPGAGVKRLWAVTPWSTYHSQQAATSPMRLLEHVLLSPLAPKLLNLERLSCCLSRKALWSHDEVPRQLDGTSMPPQISRAAPALFRTLGPVKSLCLSSRRFQSFRDLIRFLGALRGLESVYLEEICWPDESDLGAEVTLPRWVRRPEGLRHLAMVNRLCHKDPAYIIFLSSLFVHQLELSSPDATLLLHTIRQIVTAVTRRQQGGIRGASQLNSLFEISIQTQTDYTSLMKIRMPNSKPPLHMEFTFIRTTSTHIEVGDPHLQHTVLWNVVMSFSGNIPALISKTHFIAMCSAIQSNVRNLSTYPELRCRLCATGMPRADRDSIIEWMAETKSHMSLLDADGVLQVDPVV